MRLEHFSHDSMEKWCREFLCVLSDDGTERLLHSVRPCSIQSVCPYFADTLQSDSRKMVTHMMGNHDDDDDEGGFENIGEGFQMDMDEFEVPIPTLDLNGALGYSGMHHVLDNATKGLETVLSSWRENIEKAKQVTKLLRRTDMLQKLFARCFNTPLTTNLQPILKRFRGHIHEGRWGTVAFTVPELLKVKRALRFGWDMHQFIGGDHNNDGEQDTSNMAQMCDEAIGSDLWWSWLLMVEHVCSVLRQATAWLEGCPCHQSVQHAEENDELPKTLVAAWVRCPMRAHRAPELSAGELLQQVDVWCRLSSAHLVSELPRSVQGRHRRQLLQDMNAARAHLLFYLTAKTNYMEQEPWCIAQVAHLDREVAERALRRVLAGTHPHPLHQRLRGLRQQAFRFLEGVELHEPEVKAAGGDKDFIVSS